MTDTIPFWLHIVAATVWVGPQFFVFIALVPALGTIEDERARLRFLRVMTTRFGWLSWAALVILVLSGISNLFDKTGESNVIFDADFRYLWVFATKMALVGISVALTAVHSFRIGPRLLRLQEEAVTTANPVEVAGLRSTSVAISGVNLVASLAVLFAAALLANHEFSYNPV